MEGIECFLAMKNIFVILDQILADSGETQRRDLAGVSIVKGVIKPIWVR